MQETPIPTPLKNPLLDSVLKAKEQMSVTATQVAQEAEATSIRIQAIQKKIESDCNDFQTNLTSMLSESERITANVTGRLQTTVKNSSEQTINAITDTNKTIADECLSTVQNAQSKLQAITASISDFGSELSDTVKETQKGTLQELEQGDSLLNEHIVQRNPKLIQAMEKQDTELLAQRNQKISETLKFIHPLLITCIFAVVVIAILCAGLIIYTETRISTANYSEQIALIEQTKAENLRQEVANLRLEKEYLLRDTRYLHQTLTTKKAELKQVCKDKPRFKLCENLRAMR